jgi:hypothetical protein
MTVNVFYRDSRIKEYLKEGRALRIEFVCNSPDDLGCHRKLEHLPELQAKARAAKYKSHPARASPSPAITEAGAPRCPVAAAAAH